MLAAAQTVVATMTSRSAPSRRIAGALNWASPMPKMAQVAKSDDVLPGRQAVHAHEEEGRADDEG